MRKIKLLCGEATPVNARRMLNAKATMGDTVGPEPSTSTLKGKQLRTPHRTSATPFISRASMADEPTTSTSNGKQPNAPYEYQRRGAFSGSGGPKGKWC